MRQYLALTLQSQQLSDSGPRLLMALYNPHPTSAPMLQVSVKMCRHLIKPSPSSFFSSPVLPWLQEPLMDPEVLVVKMKMALPLEALQKWSGHVGWLQSWWVHGGAELEGPWRGLGTPSGSPTMPCQGKHSPRESGFWNYFKDVNDSSTPEGKEKILERGKQRSNGLERLPQNWQRLFPYSAAGVQEDGRERKEGENVFVWKKKKQHIF